MRGVIWSGPVEQMSELLLAPGRRRRDQKEQAARPRIIARTKIGDPVDARRCRSTLALLPEPTDGHVIGDCLPSSPERACRHHAGAGAAVFYSRHHHRRVGLEVIQIGPDRGVGVGRRVRVAAAAGGSEGAGFRTGRGR